MTFILRLVISGLCALVPLDNGNLLVLFVDTRPRDDVREGGTGREEHIALHYPRLSVKLKNIPECEVCDDGAEERPFVPPRGVFTDFAGDEIVNYALKREKITIVGDPEGPPSLSLKHAWFWGPRRPYVIIPGHRQDARWVVESDEFMERPNVKRESMGGEWLNVIAAIEISHGEMKVASVLKDTRDDYILWDFEAGNGTLLHRQALADKVVIDIPISEATVELRTDRLTCADPPQPKFPRFRSLRNGDIVEMSITNLPLARPTQPNLDPRLHHFRLLCERLAEHPSECITPRRVPTSGPVAGTGVICPMLTFED